MDMLTIIYNKYELPDAHYPLYESTVSRCLCVSCNNSIIREVLLAEPLESEADRHDIL